MPASTISHRRFEKKLRKCVKMVDKGKSSGFDSWKADNWPDAMPKPDPEGRLVIRKGWDRQILLAMVAIGITIGLMVGTYL